MHINPKYAVKLKKFNLNPKNIYVEESVKNSYLVSRFKNRFPEARFAVMQSLKSFIKTHRLGILDYNRRADNFFIVRENFDFFKAFGNYRHNVRLGTGEFTDSLAVDDITEFSPPMIEFFRNYPDTTFEFKTKSNNIKTLLLNTPAKNIIIGWSLNPQRIIEKNEFYAASLMERIKATQDCVSAGFDIAFHFDPIIYYNGWDKDYKALIELVFDR